MTRAQKYYEAAAILRSAIRNIDQAVKTLPAARSNPKAGDIGFGLNGCKAGIYGQLHMCLAMGDACKPSRGKLDRMNKKGKKRS